MCFRNNFKNLTFIIECFEIFIEKPNNLRASAQTYSQYKQHCEGFGFNNTTRCYKVFCVKRLGGHTSDKHITENCGYLDKIFPEDVILAHRGFNAKDKVGLLCTVKNTSIHQRQAATASTGTRTWIYAHNILILVFGSVLSSLLMKCVAVCVCVCVCLYKTSLFCDLLLPSTCPGTAGGNELVS